MPLDEDAVARAVGELLAAGGGGGRGLLPVLVRQPGARTAQPRDHRARHPELMVSLSSRGRPGVPRIRADLRHGFRRLREAGASAAIWRTWKRDLAARRRDGAVADHAVARRRLLVGGRAAAAGAAVPVRSRGRRDRRRSRPGARSGTRSDHGRYRRHELRHRADQRGKPLICAEGLIDGYAVRVPMVDVNAIGAGGGSIAWLDAARRRCASVRNRPARSPGPACYGRGGARADGHGRFDRPRLHRPGLFRRRHAEARRRSSRASRSSEQIARAARHVGRAGCARHSPRAQRADGRRHPVRFGQTRHRSARLCARAARGRRPVHAPAHWRANSGYDASSCRAIRACCRLPVCSPRRWSTRSRPRSTCGSPSVTAGRHADAFDALDARCAALMARRRRARRAHRIRLFRRRVLHRSVVSPRSGADMRPIATRWR